SDQLEPLRTCLTMKNLEGSGLPANLIMNKRAASLVPTIALERPRERNVTSQLKNVPCEASTSRTPISIEKLTHSLQQR
ncbi:Hypothetical predicted protein, partial [Pelobates cultripes]